MNFLLMLMEKCTGEGHFSVLSVNKDPGWILPLQKFSLDCHWQGPPRHLCLCIGNEMFSHLVKSVKYLSIERNVKANVDESQFLALEAWSAADVYLMCLNIATLGKF